MEFNKETLKNARSILCTFREACGLLHDKQQERLNYMADFLEAVEKSMGRHDWGNGVSALADMWQRWKADMEKAVAALAPPKENSKQHAKFIIIDDPVEEWVIRSSLSSGPYGGKQYVSPRTAGTDWTWDGDIVHAMKFADKAAAHHHMRNFNRDVYEVHRTIDLKDKEENWVIRTGQKGSYSFVAKDASKFSWTGAAENVRFFTYEDAWRFTRTLPGPYEIVKTPLVQKKTKTWVIAMVDSSKFLVEASEDGATTRWSDSLKEAKRFTSEESAQLRSKIYTPTRVLDAEKMTDASLTTVYTGDKVDKIEPKKSYLIVSTVVRSSTSKILINKVYWSESGEGGWNSKIDQGVTVFDDKDKAEARAKQLSGREPWGFNTPVVEEYA